jgi:hypothetical protein
MVFISYKRIQVQAPLSLSASPLRRCVGVLVPLRCNGAYTSFGWNYWKVISHSSAVQLYSHLPLLFSSADIAFSLETQEIAYLGQMFYVSTSTYSIFHSMMVDFA